MGTPGIQSATQNVTRCGTVTGRNTPIGESDVAASLPYRASVISSATCCGLFRAGSPWLRWVGRGKSLAGQPPDRWGNRTRALANSSLR